MAPLQEEWHWDIKKFSIKYTTQKKCQSLLKLSSINLGSGVLDIKLAGISYKDCQCMQLSVDVM